MSCLWRNRPLKFALLPSFRRQQRKFRRAPWQTRTSEEDISTKERAIFVLPKSSPVNLCPFYRMVKIWVGLGHRWIFDHIMNFRVILLCYEKSIFQKKLIAQAKDWILIISTLFQEIYMIWIPSLEYYVDSHYSLLFESRVFKGLILYCLSTVVILSSPFASVLIFVAS